MSLKNGEWIKKPDHDVAYAPGDYSDLQQLKALYAISRKLFDEKDHQSLLEKFLRAITAALGVDQGFVALWDLKRGAVANLADCGLDDESRGALSAFLEGYYESREPHGENGASFIADAAPAAASIETRITFNAGLNTQGLLGLGDRGAGLPYRDEDRNLLLALVNHLTVALKNARFMDRMENLNRDLQQKNLDLEKAFEELDRRVYHLKTLNDISKDIFSTVEFKAIVDHFLLMIMGNFGVIEGFALTMNTVTGDIDHFKATGYDEDELDLLQTGAEALIKACAGNASIECTSIKTDPEVFAPLTICALPFKVTDECHGFLGLGAKLIGEPFSEDDKELIVTLANSLVVSLTNALSFEDIKQLNADLQKKNDELKAALRKIELLEGIKANLTKFVPTVVSRLVEKSPTSEVQDAQEQDISVLFLDIEGYTKLTDEIGATEVNTLIEKYFSVFMDAIYTNEGDIVETAGDGLMVLFMAPDEKENALQAARAAAMIRDKACAINDTCTMDEKPCLVNVGVCSGKAFVGAAKFDSIAGSRWAYTTHGNTVNIAARLCGQARGGEVFCSASTMDRVKDQFGFESKGLFSLKNLPEKIEVFELK